MTQAYYAYGKAANARNDRDLAPSPFKYIVAADFLNTYAKFMDMDVGNEKRMNMENNFREQEEAGKSTDALTVLP